MSSSTLRFWVLWLCSSRQKLAESRVVETPLHYLEGRQLLRDEQDALALRQRRCDEIGDGLRLAGAGRSLDDQVLAVHGVHQRAVLRAVGVVHEGIEFMDIG